MNVIYPLEVTEGRILYGVIRSAIRAANYNFSPKNDRAILIWNDTIKDADYFSTLRPWQVVNRLPSINIICRKAPFVRLIQRIQTFFPLLYNFLPKSFILPIQNLEFIQFVNKHEKKYIIKPDNGSLGQGITIIDKKMTYNPVTHLSIAQEYIESCLVDETKFDCRIYVLVSSIENLQVYVYRGGVARFCSQKSGTNSIYSQITNTAVNRKNPGTTIDKITRMVPDVFDQLAKQGADIELLWKEIDKVAVLTILSVYNYLLQGVKKKCPNCGYSRCFQILGFDILIDKKFKPKLLEVNYRPSLERDTEAESKMKCEMLSEAMKIAVPLNEIQRRLSRSKINYNENGWKNFMKANPSLEEGIEKQRTINLKESHFSQAYPSNDPQQNALYKEVIQKVESLPLTTESKYKLPSLPSSNGPSQIESIQNSTEKLPPINGNNRNSSDTSKTDHVSAVKSGDLFFLQLSDSCETIENGFQRSNSGVFCIEHTHKGSNNVVNTAPQQPGQKSNNAKNSMKSDSSVKNQTVTQSSNNSPKTATTANEKLVTLSQCSSAKVSSNGTAISNSPKTAPTASEKTVTLSQCSVSKAASGAVNNSPKTVTDIEKVGRLSITNACPQKQASSSACSTPARPATAILSPPQTPVSPPTTASCTPDKTANSIPNPRSAINSRIVSGQTASQVEADSLQLSDSSSFSESYLNQTVTTVSIDDNRQNFLSKVGAVVAASKTEIKQTPFNFDSCSLSSDNDLTYILSDPEKSKSDDSQTVAAKSAKPVQQSITITEDDGIYVVLDEPCDSSEESQSGSCAISRAKSSALVSRVTAGNRSGQESSQIEKSYLPKLNQGTKTQASSTNASIVTKLNCNQIGFKDSTKRPYISKRFTPSGH